MIRGYKCFNKGLINRYGLQFEVGKCYHTDGKIQFGNNGNGFHMCSNLEDTLRYFDNEQEVDICEVIGFGNYHKVNDEYNGYFNLYAVENIYIKKLLTREEIISYALHLNEMSIEHFLIFYKLTEEEKELFKKVFYSKERLLDLISYYQDNDKDVFARRVLKK